MTLATRPDVRSALAFPLASSAAYGVFSGAFLGRAVALWTVARAAVFSAAVPA